VTKYVVDPGFFNVPNPVLINLKTWNNLSKKLQDILNEAAIEGEKKAVALFEDLAQKERPILKKGNIEVIDLPKTEKEKFLKTAYDEGWKDIMDKNPQAGSKLRELLTKK